MAVFEIRLNIIKTARFLVKKQAVEYIINIRNKHHLTITASDAFDFN